MMPQKMSKKVFEFLTDTAAYTGIVIVVAAVFPVILFVLMSYKIVEFLVNHIAKKL
jgi:hypothetical protein